MLLEKVYAKLHGCYEALIHGLVEKCLQDLTGNTHVKVLRKELLPPDSMIKLYYLNYFFPAIFDTVWESLDVALEKKNLVACRRAAADPFSDKNTDRLGIKLGQY
jgi:hypothetical protein